MHKTIKKVGDDLDNFQFNTAVAASNDLVKLLKRQRKNRKRRIRDFLKAIGSVCAVYNRGALSLSNQSANSIHLAKWPSYQAKYLVEEMVSIVVQVNGKLRDTIQIENTKIKSKNEIEEFAKPSQKVSNYLKGQEIKNVVYVEGKLINFVLS